MENLFKKHPILLQLGQINCLGLGLGTGTGTGRARDAKIARKIPKKVLVTTNVSSVAVVPKDNYAVVILAHGALFEKLS